MSGDYFPKCPEITSERSKAGFFWTRVSPLSLKMGRFSHKYLDVHRLPKLYLVFMLFNIIFDTNPYVPHGNNK